MGIEAQSRGLRGFGGSLSQAQSMLDIRMVSAETGDTLAAEDGAGEVNVSSSTSRDGRASSGDFDVAVAAEGLGPAVEQLVTKLVGQAEAIGLIEIE